MKTLAVGEFKSRFSEVLKQVQSGEEVIITYGKNKDSVAALIPISAHKPKSAIRLGLLRNKSAIFHDDFEMTEQELTGL